MIANYVRGFSYSHAIVFFINTIVFHNGNLNSLGLSKSDFVGFFFPQVIIASLSKYRYFIISDHLFIIILFFSRFKCKLLV